MQISPRHVVPYSGHRPGDSDLVAAATATLDRSGYAALSLVSCNAYGDHIILHGNVHTYHLKQLAQEFVLRVDGVRQVVNRLAVRRPGEIARTT